MRMPSRCLAVCVAVALSGLALGGCTGGKDTPEESPSTSVSKSASPSPTQSSQSPSPSPSPTVSIPAEAMQRTPEGAVAFVKFYFDQVNKAWTTPDSTLLPALADPVCKSCASFQADAVEFVELKHRYATAGAEASNVTPIAGAVEPAQQMLSLTLRQLPATIVDQSGATVTTKTDESFEVKALLAWKEARWYVVDIG